MGLLLISLLAATTCRKNTKVEKIVNTQSNLNADSNSIDSLMLAIKDSLINITLSLPQKNYKVKEPIIVTMKITNKKNIDFDIDPLYAPNDRELMFYFLNDKNELLKYSREGTYIDYITPSHVVKPNKTVKKLFTVNEYAPQGFLEAGSYKIFSIYRRHFSDTLSFEVVEQ
jgi:hypothetical protein